jgi:hypothetical protein
LVASEAGTNFAKGQLFSWSVVLIGLAAFALATLRSNFVKAHIEAVPAFVAPVASLSFLFLLLRWPWRDRWAGRLLLDLSLNSRLPLLAMHYRRFWQGVLIGSFGMAAFFAIIKPLFGPPATPAWRIDPFLVPLAFTLVVFVIYLITFWRSVEIRERGILYFGVLTSWRKIEAFSWERSEETHVHVVLKVKFKKTLGSWWIVLPAERRMEADAILRKQLSEWPGGTVPPPESAVTQ